MDEADVQERVIRDARAPLVLLNPARAHRAIYLLGGDKAVGRVYPGVRVLAGEMRRHEDAPLPLQELRRDLGAQVLARPVPEDPVIAALGERLHGPERAGLPPPDRRDDQHEWVGDRRLPGEER